jgi:hypothetical protein
LSTKVRLAFLLLGALLAFSGVARAGTDLIILTVAGEAYNGVPSFRVLANEEIIGVGQVSSAVDTSAGAYLTPDLSDKIARFVFTVASLAEIDVIDIEFYNDGWAGEGKPGDRNFYVIGITLSLVESNVTPLRIKTVDFPPQSFKPLVAGQKGVRVTEQWAKLANNGQLRLQRPPGGWLSQPIISAKPEKKRGIAASLPPRQKKKATNDAPEVTGSLPPPQKKKAVKAATSAKEVDSTKLKKSASAVPVEKTVVPPGNPEAEPEGLAKPRSYSRYALPKEKCRRVGEKGTDRLC